MADDTIQRDLKNLELLIALAKARNAGLPNLLSELKILGELVSALSDKIAAATASVDAALTRVQEDVATLNAKIAELEAKVKENPTPADLEALDALRDKVNALDPIKPDTLPTP